MSTRAAGHELRVGLVAVAALGGLIALLAFASDGPGFLTARREIEVDFKDGQGIRPGSPVRVAGIDAGRVTGVTLAEVDSALKARITITIPVDLANKLRQDARITIQSSLTGQCRVNIVSSGKSEIALVVGQVVQGVETSPFDPILEQVGLGPVERSHLSHTIAEVRDAVDKAAPKLTAILGDVQQTTGGLKETIDAVRPSIEGTAGHIEDVARRVNAAAPKVEAALAKLEALAGQFDGIVAENRDNIRGTLASVRDLTSTVADVVAKDRGKVERILDGAEATRKRLDLLLFNANAVTEQGELMLTRNKADIQRTIANVRDATDWADKLVQKIFANPFVLSPFYKPTPADIQVQAAYDTAQIFTKGAKELHDAVETLEAIQSKPMSAANRADTDTVRRQIADLTARLGQTSQGLADALKGSPRGRQTRRE